MTEKIGNILKMKAALDDPVRYSLPAGEDAIDMNPVIGRTLKLSYQSAIHCIACGRKTNKSFGQGHCYPCFNSLASCDMCIMKPETCHFDQGTCREPDWAQAHCMQTHYVYLANSSGIKVGITRGSQVPTRWIDQGASQAMPIFRVDNRKLSGLVEVVFKQQVSDRTDWRKMLKGEPEPVDLETIRDELFERCEQDIRGLQDEHGESAIELLNGEEVTEIRYPVEQYPQKVKSFNLDKDPVAEGTLMGIKGQYLIFDTGVLNVRKYSGYQLAVEVQ